MSQPSYSATQPPPQPKPDKLVLKHKQLAHDCSAWTLTWVPDKFQDILFTGGSDGTIKKWNISTIVNKHADLFDDDNDNDIQMDNDDDNNDNVDEKKTSNNNNNDFDVKYSVTNTATESIGISPITDMNCVKLQSDIYLLTTVTIDSYVRLYHVNEDISNNNKLQHYKTYDMNAKHKVYLCDQNGTKSAPQYLNQYGSAWSSDINSDCTVCATGDQFGQIYLWPMYADKNDQIPTVIQAAVRHVKITDTKSSSSPQKYTIRGAHAMVRGITFNKDHHPSWLAVSCQDSNRIEVVDIEKCVTVFNRKLTHKPIRDCVWYSWQDGYLIVGSDDLMVHIYDTRQNQKNSKKALVTSLSDHSSCVTSVDYCKHPYVVSSSMDNTIKLWDLTNNSCIETKTDHTDQVWKVRFNPQQNKLASIGDDGNLCLYAMQ